MNKIKIFFSLLFLSVLFLYSSKGYGQNENSLNQHSKNKNVIGTDNKPSNPKKSKVKVARNKQGALSPNPDEDSLPVDSTSIAPAIIITRQKPN